MMSVFTLLAFSAAPPVGLPLGQTTGRVLVEFCEEKPGRKMPNTSFLMSHMYCKAYLSAVVDVLVGEELEKLGSKREFCNDSTFAKGTDPYWAIVKKLYEDNPAYLRYLAGPKVKAAIKNAFPCR